MCNTQTYNAVDNLIVFVATYMQLLNYGYWGVYMLFHEMLFCSIVHDIYIYITYKNIFTGYCIYV